MMGKLWNAWLNAQWLESDKFCRNDVMADWCKPKKNSLIHAEKTALCRLQSGKYIYFTMIENKPNKRPRPPLTPHPSSNNEFVFISMVCFYVQHSCRLPFRIWVLRIIYHALIKSGHRDLKFASKYI